MKNKIILLSVHTTTISNIMSSYCRFIDSKKWKSIKKLFTKNARMVFLDTEGKILFEFNDTKALVYSAKEAVGQYSTQHHLHNPEISLLNAKEALCIWAMEDRFYINENAPHPFFHGAGYYHIKMKYVNNKWKINELVLRRLRLSLAENHEERIVVMPIRE